MRFPLHTLLTLAMAGTAFVAFAGWPELDSPAGAWLTGLDVFDLSRRLAAGFTFASLACAFAAFVAALAAEERVPAGFWVWYFVVTALSALLWLVTLPWIQSARE